jgi:hypothetical protein
MFTDSDIKNISTVFRHRISFKEVVEINEEDQTITIKFSYQIVEEDNYIGLAQY